MLACYNIYHTVAAIHFDHALETVTEMIPTHNPNTLNMKQSHLQ
jgi:hypothetical protein